MAWIRYESGVLRHPKWQKIPFGQRPDAIALHIGCSGYSGDYLTDGFVPDNIIPSIAHEAGVKDATKTLTNLRNSRLIRKVRGGIQIHDYLDYNPSKEDVEKRRKEDAERKKAAREAASRKNPSAPPSAEDSAPLSAPPSKRNPRKRPPRALPRAGAGARSHPVPSTTSSPTSVVEGTGRSEETAAAAVSAKDATPPPNGGRWIDEKLAAELRERAAKVEALQAKRAKERGEPK